MPKVLSLMNFPGSYQVTAHSALFKSELDWIFLKNGTHIEEALFVSYAYNGNDYPGFFQEVSSIFAQSGTMLTDIRVGNPENLIKNAKMIVIGGGDIAFFFKTMGNLITSTFNPYNAIRDRINQGIPYMGWNEGSNIQSPNYLIPPSSVLPQGINATPVQIICNYLNSPTNKAGIFNYLAAHSGIKKAIALTDQLQPGGKSVRLEETGVGIVDSGNAPYPAIIRFKIVNGVPIED